MSDANSLPLSETHAPICPHCLSVAEMIRTEYRCPDCANAFVFLRRIGLTTSPQQFTTSPQQWSRVPYPSPRKEAVPDAEHPPVARSVSTAPDPRPA